MSLTAAQLLLDVLADAGVRHIFGNPGSTEMPLMDALTGDDRWRYILALHEIPAVAMADGYAQATRQPGVVNVHISCGLGNAMGMLYNAWCSGTPLLLTAGQQDRRLLAEGPVLAGDTVAVARPWTKWSHEVHRSADLAPAVRRALRVAQTPPTGPVFLSLPVDLQSERIKPDNLGAPDLPTLPHASAEALEQAAKLLAEARSPVILAGSRVTEYGASEHLAVLARQLGAPVYSDTHASQGRFPIASNDPLYAGALPLWSPEIRDLLLPHDVALVIGIDFLRQYVYQEPACPIPESTRLVQLDINSGAIGKNYPVAAGVVGDLPAALQSLQPLIAARQNSESARSALERRDRIGERRAAEQTRLQAEIAAAAGSQPMATAALIGALAKVWPHNAALVEEAPTTNRNLLARLGALQTADAGFGHRGWALGWGLGAAVGVKLAWGDRPVVCLLGDGAALYGIQGLWTAARYRIPVIFIVANNAEYKILKDVSGVMGLPHAASGNYLGCDITDPEIDYVSLARSFGMDALNITAPDELGEVVEASFESDRPVLLNVPVER